MKRFGWILVLLTLAVPAWAAKTVTVQQLKDMLVSLQQDKKSDAEVAAELKQIELSEELTRATMNSLVSYVPGPMSTEQIYVLEARSADLAPQASDLPAIPAPDAAAQRASEVRLQTLRCAPGQTQWQKADEKQQQIYSLAPGWRKEPYCRAHHAGWQS